MQKELQAEEEQGESGMTSCEALWASPEEPKRQEWSRETKIVREEGREEKGLREQKEWERRKVADSTCALIPRPRRLKIVIRVKNLEYHLEEKA
ncbi:hypothetical protein WR25_14901 [Diploscapter pachys]|uniref:Uncharacterized protein n=1 Tax=Diploscapter pachys TaxID=2018661 RepID=A0A2A2J3Y5_9BILA|nr:hypothetical protein WR25_14901 [Diploscapter pachys]